MRLIATSHIQVIIKVIKWSETITLRRWVLIVTSISRIDKSFISSPWIKLVEFSYGVFCYPKRWSFIISKKSFLIQLIESKRPFVLSILHEKCRNTTLAIVVFVYCYSGSFWRVELSEIYPRYSFFTTNSSVIVVASARLCSWVITGSGPVVTESRKHFFTALDWWSKVVPSVIEFEVKPLIA